MSKESEAITKRNLVVDLLMKFNAAEATGAGNPSHPHHEKRNELLDDLQDAVGLAGRMVMERDIIKRATQLVNNNS